MTCINCGYDISKDMNFCPYCGLNVSDRSPFAQYTNKDASKLFCGEAMRRKWALVIPSIIAAALFFALLPFLVILAIGLALVAYAAIAIHVSNKKVVREMLEEENALACYDCNFSDGLRGVKSNTPFLVFVRETGLYITSRTDKAVVLEIQNKDLEYFEARKKPYRRCEELLCIAYWTPNGSLNGLFFEVLKKNRAFHRLSLKGYSAFDISEHLAQPSQIS